MNQSEIVDRLAQYSVVLLGFSMTTASFLYSVIVQLARANAPNVSDWAALIHLVITSGILFLSSFVVAIVYPAGHRRKGLLASVSATLFAIGLVFVLSVLVFLYLETRV